MLKKANSLTQVCFGLNRYCGYGEIDENVKTFFFYFGLIFSYTVKVFK